MPTASYLLLFSCIAVVSTEENCNRDYLRGKIVLYGVKDTYLYYPWLSFRPVEGRVVFLIVNERNVKHLCRNLKIYENVTEMVANNVGLEYIECGLFDNTKVKNVNLQYNKLKTIKNGIFTRTNIVSLVLADNVIETIEPGAFDHMTKLEAISLDGNKLIAWDGGWFNGIETLYEVSVSGNFLVELPGNVTRHIVGSSNRISGTVLGSLNFDNNYIKSVHPGAFVGVENFGKISLSNNLLKELEVGTFSGFKFLYGLYLNSNQLQCVPRKGLEGVKKLFLGNNPIGDECKWKLEEYFDETGGKLYF